MNSSDSLGTFDWVSLDESQVDDVLVENDDYPDEYVLYNVSERRAKEMWIAASGEGFVNLQNWR
ncbi:hypothetical protein [Natrinema halophilum]|uniref:hypothetical protein n=1 Tax=Natrinema halophilum TaxID=1699371 RepID=UPI001F3F6D86|nr:hypothetical protein [Natrinema halophilum]UHQ96331.1 hypothetical protein HYG82_21985 [Natrinema halophilum]